MSDESEQVENARDERVRAVIADDDPFARRVIKEALTESGVMIVAEARNGRRPSSSRSTTDRRSWSWTS